MFASVGEPEQDWDRKLVERVHYLPQEKSLVAEVERLLKTDAVPDVARKAAREVCAEVINALPGSAAEKQRARARCSNL